MNQQWQHIQQKIQNLESAVHIVKEWQQQGFEVVFTNGCFDLIHYGHVCYLAEARSLGDRLIVALNSDASVQKYKGSHRPIANQQSRTHVMAAFEFVDLVIVFEEDTPYEVIKALKPDILVKGGDWKIHEIVGSDIVMEHGGLVKSLRFEEGFSTTSLEQKIISEYLKNN